MYPRRNPFGAQPLPAAFKHDSTDTGFVQPRRNPFGAQPLPTAFKRTPPSSRIVWRESKLPREEDLTHFDGLFSKGPTMPRMDTLDAKWASYLQRGSPGRRLGPPSPPVWPVAVAASASAAAPIAAIAIAPVPPATQLREILQNKKNLTVAQVDDLASTGFDLSKRRDQQSRVDGIVARFIKTNHPKTFTDLLQAAQKKPTFLQGGVYGITALMELPGVSAPLVAKFSHSPKETGCIAEIGPMVCVSRRNPTMLDWTARDNPARERDLYGFFSDVENLNVSPHFLHTYLAAPVTLVEGASIREIATWLGARSRKASEYPDDKSSLLSVSILEFGGVPALEIFDSVVKIAESRIQRNLVRSYMVQVFQALATMAEVADVHHNDCHMNNIIGCVTTTEYLNYQIFQVKDSPTGGKATLTSRCFRVPTYGILYRIIDFGLATSTTLFGARDHGIMTRTCNGGPMWPEAVDDVTGKIPLEIFDVARVLKSLRTLAADGLIGARAAKDVSWAVDTAIGLGDANPAVSRPKRQAVNIAHRFYPGLSIEGARDVSVQNSMIDLCVQMSENHRVMMDLFISTAQHFGFEITKQEAKATFTKENTYTLAFKV